MAWADSVKRDARHGLRGFLRERTVSLTIVLTLALGVTTTTTVFSVADAGLWRPLPFPRAEELVYLSSYNPQVALEAVSLPDLQEWRAGAPAFLDLAGVGFVTRRVLRSNAAESVRATEVTSNYFSLLGRTPLAGRTFARAPSGGRELVLTDRAWQRLFNRDPVIVGRSVLLDGAPAAIVGVVSADDSLGPDPDLFVNADDVTSAAGDAARPPLYGAIGRLLSSASVDSGRAQVQAIAERRRAPAENVHRIVVERLSQYSRANNWRALVFFLGASLVVLVLSATNAATLLLERATRRTREFALRLALGSGTRALARQLLVESFLLAAPAGALGLLLAAWCVRALETQLPSSLTARGPQIPVDLRAAAFAVAMTVLTIAIFALAPIVLARRVDLSSGLRQGGRVTGSKGEGRARHLLLTAQIALTMVLMAGAGMFVKSFVALTQVPLGFDPRSALVVRTSLAGPRYATNSAVQVYVADLLGAVGSVPGVAEAAIGSSTPLGSGSAVTFVAHDLTRPAEGAEPRAIIRAVSPEYFHTLGIRLTRGRGFDSTDISQAPRVAIVNESLARRVFGDSDPIGRVIDFVPGGAAASWAANIERATIIGLVSNVKDVGLYEDEFLDIYVPFSQVPAPSFDLVVRAALPTTTLVDAIRQRASQIDPAIPVTSITTFDERIAAELRGHRFNLLLISTFAVLAILLAGIGVYGAVAYSVQARTREFAIRLALGARPARLVGAAIWRAARVGVTGGALGLVGAVMLAIPLGNALYLVPRVHVGILYGVSTTDPMMLALALAGIVALAVVAGAVPARRCASVLSSGFRLSDDA
jgi:putative ABC transport system permease protein